MRQHRTRLHRLALPAAVPLAVALLAAGAGTANAASSPQGVVAYQSSPANENELALYNSAVGLTQPVGMEFGTSPSIATELGEPSAFAVAIANSNNELYIDTSNGILLSSGPDLETGTSPSIALVPTIAGRVAIAVAFVAPGDTLTIVTYTTTSNNGYQESIINTGDAVTAGTSPSVALDPGGSGNYEVAYEGTDDARLAVYSSSTGTSSTVNLGMLSGTSPSITTDGTSFEVAVEANTDYLYTQNLTSSARIDTGLGMPTSGGSSPAIAWDPSGTGEFQAAFQANTGKMWTYEVDTKTADNTGFGMKSGSSPSISGSLDYGYELAFQANTGVLWYWHSNGNTQINTGITMEANPSISG